MKCIEDEIPFDVPVGWEWCRLPVITTDIFAGGDKPDIYEKRQTEICNIPIYSNGIENDGLYGYTNKPRVTEPSITISARGTIGFCCARKTPFVPIVRLITITPSKEINLYYLKTVFEALIETGEGSSIPQLTVPGIKPKLIPIPPIMEQDRIQSKQDEILKYISDISFEKDELRRIVQQAKNKILDLAIRGKLVSQDPNDEPASVLLERIRAEKEELIKQGKIKRNKKESFIFRGDDNSYYEKIGDDIESIDAEIPFNLPDNWIWCRGYSCFSGMESTKPQGEFFDYIDIDSIDNRSHCVRKTKHIPVIEAPSRASRAINSGSVLFSLVRPYLENIALIEREIHSHSIASTGFYVCNSNGLLLPEYMFYLMISKYVVDGLNRYMKGDNSPSISKNDIENWLYPIPPIAEQKRICYILKSTYAIIEELEESLI